MLPPDEAAKELKRLVALYDGTSNRMLVGLSPEMVRDKAVTGVTLNFIPTGFWLSPFSFLLGWTDIATTLSFSGGVVVALKFLREARGVLEAYLASKSKQKVVIKAGGISVEIHGSHDVDMALATFSRLAETPITQTLSVTGVQHTQLEKAESGSDPELPPTRKRRKS